MVVNLEISLCISKLYQCRYHDAAMAVQSSVEEKVYYSSMRSTIVFAL